MSYTPINWQTGDIITAEKLNKMDNGWSAQTTQLFSETVTTVADEPDAFGTLAYSNEINATQLTVTFNGTDYKCERVDIDDGIYSYGDADGSYSVYPFRIVSANGVNTLSTENAGAYTVAAGVVEIEISDNFESAVVEATPNNDFEIVSGTTTYAEAYAAFIGKKNVYYFLGESQKVSVLYVGYIQDAYRVVGVVISTSDLNPYSVNLQASSEDGVLS